MNDIRTSTPYRSPLGRSTLRRSTLRRSTLRRRVGLGALSVALALVLSPVQATATSSSQQAVGSANAAYVPYLDAKLPIDQRVADLLTRMTLEEKIGQMTQAERGTVADNPALIAQQRLGSVLSGGGSTPPTNTPAAWVEMVNTFQVQALSTRLHIPLIYGIDAVHGHGNVYSATIFPHNIGLGSTRDPALVARVGRVTASEVRATGIPWSFGPCVCVARDERWGRTYESFGEDPALVVSMETIIDGLQGKPAGKLDEPDRVLATAKHYAGDGDTEYDHDAAARNVGKPWWEQVYTIDQGVTVSSRPDFWRIDLAPYGAAINNHSVGSVMPSFSSVDFTEDGVGNPVKMHAHRELITDVLKSQLGFKRFVISDWEGIHQIRDPANPTDGGLTAYKVRTGVNAGIDMFMEPFSAGQFQSLLLAEVDSGGVSTDRIDDAVRRILHAKFELGLFEHPFASLDGVDTVGSAKNRRVARQAVAQSQVLLKNDGGALPLSKKAKVYVAGRNADDIGNQAGGWTIAWQGISGEIIPGTTILEGVREVAPKATVTYSPDASVPMTGSDVGVVVVGETPYAEGYGDIGGPECGWCTPAQQEEKSLRLQPSDRAVIDRVCDTIPTCVVLVISGRPQVLADQLGKIDALVASWLPGSEGAGVADVLFGRRPFTGRLSMTWPRTQAQVPINVGDTNYDPLFPFGWGLQTENQEQAVVATLSTATDPSVRAAGNGLTAALARPTGSARDSAVLAALGAAMTAADQSTGTTPPQEAIVAAARDIAQSAVIEGRANPDWARSIAQADHALLAGDATTAFALLAGIPTT